ncbi:MAG: ABC transporter substrate-binding protein [Clostridia bacterium]|nr:ABC transporter substrate-binding protein [Clostridia bacterium]
MIKKALLIFLVLLMSLSLFACSSDENTEPTETTTVAPLPTVAVLSLELDENTQSAYDGFLTALSSNGYTENDNYTLVHKECKAKKELDKAADAIVEEEPALIYAIGTDAAKAAKKATSTVPVVFSCVNDPVGSKLVKSCEKPEANVTGVSDYSPVFEQIELIDTLYPDAKRIGCLYNGADEDSIFSANLANAEAVNRGIKFTLYSALTESDYSDELDKALEKCDVLYITDDALVKSGLEETLKSAKKKKVPVFAESTELVESGCLATCITDYEHIGYSAGELGAILLRSIKPVSDIPVEYATDCTVVVNSKTQKSLKLTLPDDIEDTALFVKTS